MFYEALHLVNMRDAPNLTATDIGDMVPNDVGRLLEETPAGDWRKLEILTQFFPPRTGWVKSEASVGPVLREVEAPPREDFSLWAFLKTAVECEIRFNETNADAGFFIIADYLVAWADIESKLKNIGNKNPITDGVGPFQITTADWERFRATTLGSEFVAEDREDGLSQISGAAFLAFDAMVTVSEAVRKHDVESNDQETSGPTGPYIPSYVDVLIANLFGAAFAIDVRLAKLRDQAGVALDGILATHFAGNGGTLVEFRKALLTTTDGRIETIDGFLLKMEALLTAALQKAFKLIGENIPEDLPKVDGTAPWMTVAAKEEIAWQGELNSDAERTARILSYFASIGFDTDKVLPWCGAFAGSCMKASGAPFSATVVKDAARAASWANWGNMSIPPGSPDVPAGAVVVLAPEKGSARSGHVGFFNRYFGPDSNLVEILGGNQSGTVTKTKFARSKIVAIRWFSPIEARDGKEAQDTIATLDHGRLTGLMDLIGQLESNNNYNAYFGNSANEDHPEFTTMTVRDVIEWQRRFIADGKPSSAVGRFQFLRKTLAGLRDNGVTTSDSIFNRETQDDLAIALMKGRGLGRYLARSLSPEDFGVSLAKEWAALPVPKDVKRGSRIVRSGQSYYAGVSGNRALVSVEAYMKVLHDVLA